MEKVRAKFYCNTVTDKPELEQVFVSMGVVTNGCEENKSFFKYTPSGLMTLVIGYDTPASGFFEEGNEYYLDISRASE